MAQCRRRGGDRIRGARSRQPDGLSLILEFRFLRLERVSEASLGTARAQRLRLRGMRRPADRPGGLDSRPDAAVRIGEARLVKGCGAGEESRRYGLARALTEAMLETQRLDLAHERQSILVSDRRLVEIDSGQREAGAP